VDNLTRIMGILNRIELDKKLIEDASARIGDEVETIRGLVEELQEQKKRRFISGPET